MANTPTTTNRIHPELTPMQSALVEHMMVGNQSLAECITDAGYADKSSGYAAWKTDKVQSVFQRACMEKLAAHVPTALSTQLHLMQHAKSEYVRLQAAQDAMDRVGLKTETQASLGNLQINIDLSA